MKLLKLISNPVLFAAFGALLIGCSPRSDLRPAPSADTKEDRSEVAVDKVKGVSVLAQSDAWPSNRPIEQEVIPVRVKISNEGATDLRFRYSELALVTPNGDRYMALPPYQVEGEVSDSRYVNSTTVTPGFGYTNFYVSPMYGNMYGSSIGTYTSPYFYDYGYYNTYGGYWIENETQLPTQRMINMALPEGVIEPGGMIDGFVYFERLPSDVDRVTFRADLVDADDGQEFGEIRIPFRFDYVSQN